LINIIPKIYSHVIQSRLMKWSCTQENIMKNHFGFQKNKSTTDCIFALYAISSKVLSEGDKLYCAFIDYGKAFDRVDRNMLWHKLIKEGTCLL
jgi:hypothetical protein